MAIKVGNSWVSEAAYAYAKHRVGEGQDRTGKSDSDMLQELSEKFPDLKFSTNTAPFSGKGLNNMAISPNILRQMKEDPEKRVEYEALLYDCNSIQKSIGGRTAAGSKVVAHGFIINADGTLGAWSISQSGGEENRFSCLLPKDDKGSWMKRMSGGLKDARSGQGWRA